MRMRWLAALLLLVPLASWAPPLPRRAAGGGGGGGAPVIEQIGAQSNGNNIIRLTLTAPAGITAGETLLLVVSTDGTHCATVVCNDVATPAKTYTISTCEQSARTSAILATRTADGAEGNAECVWDGSTVEDSTGRMLRVSGVSTIATNGAWNSNSSAVSQSSWDHPDPTTTVNDTLVLGFLSADGDPTSVTYPTELTDNQTQQSFGGGNGTMMAFATAVDAISGAFTISSWTSITPSEEVAAATILLEP